MGKINRGILGGFSGKVASVVGGAWKGIEYMRALPVTVSNPNSTAQQAQRTKMRTIVALAQGILGTILQPFWNPISQRMSGFNRFVKDNIAQVDGAGVITFVDIRLTEGPLQASAGLNCSADDSDDNIVVSWTNNSGVGNALATDEAIIAVYNETQGYWLTNVDTETRNSSPLNIADTRMVAGDTLNVYISFHKQNDNTYCSESNWDSCVVTA